MGIRNRDGTLYEATGIDNTGLYKGRREAMGIIKAMAGQIINYETCYDVTCFLLVANSYSDFVSAIL